MERPSHIAFQPRHYSQRLPLIGLAVSFQAGALWLFMHGFGGTTIKIPEGPIVLTPFEESKHPPVEPPKPTLQPVTPVTAVPPIFTTAEPTRESGLTTVAPRPDPGPVASSGVTSAPVSISATHTVPPYPPIARRLGAEGKVTLRLTVSAEGRVAQADIVTSSGRDDLDQTARQWIMAHWRYKPALANGAPAASQTLASVTFSLTNER